MSDLPLTQFEIDLNRLAESIPADVRSDPARLQKWVEDAITQIQVAYAALEPRRWELAPDEQPE